MKNRRVVVAGGAGFIGSNLAQQLAVDNEVIIIDDLSTGREENLGTRRAEFHGQIPWVNV